MINADRTGTAANDLVLLVYELLDAHVDTITLAGQSASGDDWAAHLDYLRDLQRVGREALAHL